MKSFRNQLYLLKNSDLPIERIIWKAPTISLFMVIGTLWMMLASAIIFGAIAARSALEGARRCNEFLSSLKESDAN